MALTLSKTNITTGQTIQASQITQSVDALTGTTAYDITISGSLTLTGSVNSLNGYTGSLLGTSSFAVSASRAVTASFALNATSPFPFNGNAVITGSLNVTSNITGSNIKSTNITTSDTITIEKSLKIGNEDVANRYLNFDANNDITVPTNSFTPANMNTPDAWQVIKYKDNTNTLRTAYIPVYYTSA